MAFRRMAISLMLVALGAAACGGDDEGLDSGGISVDDPIGAPDTVPGSVSADPPGSIDEGPSVVKTATVDVDVAKEGLNSAAQAVVDLATSPRIGGFLVTSVVDLDAGYGLANVAVQVPSTRFEQVVGELGDIGEVTRQELHGQDLSPDFLATQTRLHQVRRQISRLLGRLQSSVDTVARFDLRQKLNGSREDLRSLEQRAGSINAQTAYSSIGVSINGMAPTVPPEKPAIKRAFATAKSLAIAIASGAVLTAGVVVPIGLLALLVYLGLAPVVRRFRPRLET
ncbi:MAG: hypothetical protein QOK47_533 [Actinomycetota bacterium]|nr:hypothetical protein [Actinomycetota bacterium]